MSNTFQDQDSLNLLNKHLCELKLALLYLRQGHQTWQ